MTEHYIEYCVECREVISQCRCPDKNKTIIYSLCKTCKEKKDEDVNGMEHKRL